ncbi:MAG: hypothetical protein LBT31_05390 [Synergistaceae bacterium]|jgi:hypothetical protein|nr:hypothetical protein [Synergistaceae bacterium]
MEVVPISSPDFWRALFRAEAILTVNIIAGLLTGEVILSLGIVDRIFAPLVPLLSKWGIHRTIAGAMLVSLGAPRSGAALIAAAYADGDISEQEATYGTLSLAFPGYLRRWVGTAAMAFGMAGLAGLIYSAVLIARSAIRFLWVTCLLRNRMRNSPANRTLRLGADSDVPASDAKARRKRLLKTLKRSLPWAWLFFAITYSIMPLVETLFTDHVTRWGLYAFLPPEGWAVAVSALAHVTAALSSAGGALASGELSVAQAVLALLVGNMVGTITRTMRQNVGYWMGIFPAELVPRLLRWHFLTMFSLEILSIFIAWSFGSVV